MTGERTLRVGLVGFGVWGRRLFEKCSRFDGIEFVGIADPRSESPLGAVPRFSALRELSLATKPDAVLIAVSPSKQGEIALEAVELGLAAFVEKPLAMDAELARTIERRARERNVVVGVGHVVRYEHAFEVASLWISDGKLGSLLSIESERFGARPRADATPLWVLGPHELSRIFALTGGAMHIESSRVGASEAHFVFMRGGVRCEVRVGLEAPKRRRIEFVGTRGKVVVDESTGRATLETTDGRNEHFEGRNDALAIELHEFFRAVRTGTAPRTDVAEGRAVVEALEALERFAKRRTPVGFEGHALARVE